MQKKQEIRWNGANEPPRVLNRQRVDIPFVVPDSANQ